MKTWVSFLLLLAVLYAKGNGVHAEQKTEAQLKDLILKDYDSYVRPVKNYHTTIRVSMQLNILRAELDDATNVLHSATWIKMSWNDDYLKWNDKKDFSNIKYLSIDSDLVWIPDILLYNSATAKGSVPSQRTHVVIMPEGTVLWVPPFSMSTFCDADFSTWPFDSQTCEIKMGSWTFDETKISLNLEVEKVIGEVSHGSPNWEVQKVTAKKNSVKYPCCPDLYQDVTFTVTLRRIFVFDRLLATFPAIAVCILTLTMFWVPPASVQKTILGGVNMVVVVVVLLTLRFVIPKTGHSVPRIIIFYSVTLFIVVFSLVLSVVVTNMAAKQIDVPLGWRKLTLGCWRKLFCLPERKKKEGDPNIEEDSIKVVMSREEEWAMVCRSFDRLFFYLFLIFILIMLCLYL